MASRYSTTNGSPAFNRTRDIFLGLMLLLLFINTRHELASELHWPLLRLGLSIPLFGVLTRYRAHYTPRTTVADAEAVSTAEKHEQVKPGGLITIARQVVQRNGWAALWRGWGTFCSLCRYNTEC